MLSPVTLDEDTWLKIEALLVGSSGGAAAVVVTTGRVRRGTAIVEKVVEGGEDVEVAVLVKEVDKKGVIDAGVVTVGLSVKEPPSHIGHMLANTSYAQCTSSMKA